MDEGELRERIARGELGGEDLVWRQGMEAWEPLSMHPQLMPLPGPPPVAAESPYQPPLVVSGSAVTRAGAEIPNYLWQSIAVTILCCWPLGIPAIIYAAKVDGLKARGELAAARAASDSAKLWCTLSVGCTLVVVVIGLLFGMFSGPTG